MIFAVFNVSVLACGRYQMYKLMFCIFICNMYHYHLKSLCNSVPDSSASFTFVFLFVSWYFCYRENVYDAIRCQKG